jgi:regulator of protease activity HflC (stomatin/prohibitin superfamily)
MNYVEIADVDLPSQIAEEIVNKETQKQKNLTKLEEQYLADARIEKARGDSSLLISASYKAAAIRKESEQINKNPAYIEYIKWKGFADGKGSPYGTNNVFGAVSILKTQ